jgi:hypothetical protein
VGKTDLTDIHRVFHPMVEDNTFFLTIHRNFSKIDYILGHKTNLIKYKK